ncbi:hypothetical protein NDU88_004164 [Pleurodeles waltl]|uniref:Uncharacterized protein n=1 Tax=Pleurodeles waltl TaxID=8319 RepID=A0AAV7QBT0_PLEWA|nr:hypothetical protein NDU88_004164 [Pleurodeles waltl]
MPHCSSGGPVVLLVRERPSSATHSRSVQPHHLARFLRDSGGRGSEGAAPSISYYPGVVLAGRAGTKGAATSASPLGATSPQAVPGPPGTEDPDTPRAKRPRSLTVPAPLGIRPAEFGRVSPSEDPGEGGGLPRCTSAALAALVQQRPLGVSRSRPEYRATPLQGTARSSGRPLSRSPRHPASPYSSQPAPRGTKATPPFGWGLKKFCLVAGFGRMTEGSRALLECDRHLDVRSHALHIYVL